MERMRSGVVAFRARGDADATEPLGARAGLLRSHKAGSTRFVLLVLVLLATAVLVTVAMFRALYIVMG